MILTHHAKQRLKQRSGLRESAMLKTSERAWEKGARITDFSGSFRHYLEAGAINHPGRQVRIYDDRLWAFAADVTLITVIMLPGQYRAAARRRLAEMKEAAK